ncbi:putative transcription factor interactor and regulator CCHC(Zn) family [Helianthus annuus]|nr:putative transcription factor interactor and regulator CCHC(Zn) family [Helianthus annuus]KAJ0553042.1 putative transcription factor interactor and regulator CCHC(Zn) family [Helianthus annuus]KAJ0897283.1 putative transcription factor interactor and regulator CCHC(Zn) family [Helianthus annuus]KAJ0901112.1 putative transcription factor interactor and regulator CCHC(Zn) family [Helianthus annuus]
MDEDFYNAFATPSTPAVIAKNINLENEMGTAQKPPKLMDIDHYNVWSERFGNWVEAYHLDAWEHTEEQYGRPTRNNVENGVPLTLREMSSEDKKKYRDEKLMVSLLQQAIKEDILILLQHDGTAYSIWSELEAKFIGSDDMLKNKMSLMKKEFDLFRVLKTENTKQIIDRYCNLVRNMSKLGIKKNTDELVEKLADALPYETWGTFLMMLRSNRKDYKSMTLGDFIKHLEAQEMEQRRIARMKNYDGEQDISLYYKGGVSGTTNHSPKIETAFSVKDSSEQKSSQGSSSTRFSSFDPNISVTKNGRKLQCNIVLSIENDEDYTEEIAKNQMSLLGMVLESYSSFVAGKIGNPMLTKEDYDQIDAEEMELMDIKWCMASVMRRAEKFKQITGRDDFCDANVSTLGFDKSKVTCFRCREKGHFKRECKNREATGAQNPFGNNDYHKKAIYHQVTPPAQHQAQTAHGRDVIDGSKRACLGKYENFTWDKYLPTNSKVCLAEQDDEKLAEGFNWDDFCPDKDLMAKEMFKNTSNAFFANAHDLKCVERNRKVMEAAEARRRKLEEEEEDEERLKAEAKAEKKRRAEFLQPNRTVKEVPEFEVKVDAEPSEVPEKCMNCDSLIKQNNELLHNINRLKESYDTMNREINKYTDSSGEQAVAMNTLKIAHLRQLDDANFHIKKCADLELELATQKIETEKVKKLLESYSCSSFVVDRIYPVVENLKTFEEVKTSGEKKSVTKDEEKMKTSGKKSSVVYNRCPPPVENGYSPRNPNSERVEKAINLEWESGPSDNLPENIDVTYTSSDTDHESKLIKSVVDQVLDKDDIEESNMESKPESKSGSNASKPTFKKDKRVYDKEFLM